MTKLTDPFDVCKEPNNDPEYSTEYYGNFELVQDAIETHITAFKTYLTEMGA